MVLGGKAGFGRRLAQAASAFWTDALFVLSVVDVVARPPKDPAGKVTPWSFRQLRYAVKATFEKPPAPAPNPFGRRLAQAASAFWVAAFLVFSVVDVVELTADPLGNVTPWSFRQLRYAARAALENPPVPLPNPCGRRLAHAAEAFRNADELKPPPAGEPPAGKLPVAPVPNPPNFTPCFCMHAWNAEREFPGLLVALVAAVVVEVVEAVALGDPPPHALNATDPASTIANRGYPVRQADLSRDARNEGLYRRSVPLMGGLPWTSGVMFIRGRRSGQR